MIFDRRSYDILALEAFQPSYAGYRPHVTENPNGDGKEDAGKRYSHIALKYNPSKRMLGFLAAAHFEACRVAEALRVPAEFYPRVEDATLRILEYPPGCGSETHTDFDLFTILCYRETPQDLKLTSGHLGGSPVDSTGYDRVDEARKIDPFFHVGEIGEIVGLGPATPHCVVPRDYVQRSIVCFAMPSHKARFPQSRTDVDEGAWHGRRVGDWLAERKERSRNYR